MLITRRYKENSQHTALPVEVYETIVRSLYGNVRTLVAGKFATIIAGVVACNKFYSPVLLACIFLLSIVAIGRAWSIVRFNAKADRPLTYNELARAERNYMIFSGAYVGMIGTLCFCGFVVSDDPVVHMLLLSICLANVAGISGRNFASAKVVNLQAMVATVPPTLGLMFFGDFYHIALACMLMPFLLAIQSIARHLRKTLMDATFQALENKTIADRFEAALTNASHGMAMVDSDGVFVVANDRFSDLFGLSKDFNLVGASLPELTALELQANDAGISKDSCITDRIRNCQAYQDRTQFTHTQPDGTTIEITFNPMKEGAGVIVLEDVTSRMKSEREIRQLADYDPLTHLPNRRHFTKLIHERIQLGDKQKNFSLYFADLDNFKTINDSLGHPIGDKLLCAVSLRMKSCLPEGGLICRFGGDEFVLVIPEVIEQEDCERFARQLMSEISKPVLIDGHLIIVGVSVGVAKAPENGNDLDQLLKKADMALYEAKDSSRDKLFFYTECLGEKTRKRQELEVELRRAVQKGELHVHYQPLVDHNSGKIVCCEALVRWQHPMRGNIPPSEFIPMAEEIGLISKIGRFVLEEATIECAKWPDNVRVAVNVSSLQFQQSDICNVVATALNKSGLPASRLEVEVTESAMLDDLHHSSQALRTLAQGGIRIALDDFGTGFSSLSYLHQLPLDKVKIDRSFLKTIEEDDRSLILMSGVSKLAKELGLEVVAEGVEEENQLKILKEKAHVDQIQGYLFGKPMPATDIRQVLLRQCEASNQTQEKVAS